jgi:cation diffusion facilitator family transporter
MRQIEPKPRANSFYAALSILSNSSLIALKLFAGLMTGSMAIVSEALHSFLDLLASFMAFWAVRFSSAPADADHPFGHGKAESLAALLEALLIVAGGLWIAIKAGRDLFQGGSELPDLRLGLAVMAASGLVNFLISKLLFKIGRERGSPALTADGWHLRTDVYTSMGIFLALALISLGRAIAPDLDLTFLDPASALIVSLMILKTGLSLAWTAATSLIDHSLGPEELLLIAEHIGEMHPKIRGYRRLRTRRSGPFRLVNVDLLVDGDISVSEAHSLGLKATLGILEHFPEADITFHLEPDAGQRSKEELPPGWQSPAWPPDPEREEPGDGSGETG